MEQKPEKPADTDRILSSLRKSDNISDYIDQNIDKFNNLNLAERLSELIHKKKLVRADVIAASGIDRVYAYEILRAKKTPRRDTLIRLLLSMQLALEEIQQVLKSTGYAALYPKNMRDAIIIYGIEHRYNVIDLNILLDDSGQEPV